MLPWFDMDRVPWRTATLPFRGAWLSALACSLGCSGEVNRSAGPDVGAEAGVEPPGHAGTSACDHYFAATHSRCGGPVLPASETTRIRARFEQLCQNEMALPGSGVTPDSLDACATALEGSPCDLPAGPPPECAFHGALPGGAACTDSIQCQSAGCSGTASYTPEGQTGPFTCGTCEPLAPVGQVCGHADFSAGCPGDAACLLDESTSGDTDPTYTCVAITEGAAGAACDDLTAICQTGLACSSATGQCVPLVAAGTACGVAPGWPGGCAAPLACSGGVCTSGAAGASCFDDVDCAVGLGCACAVGGCASPTCEAITWVAAGQPCSAVARCLVGTCDLGSVPPGPPSSDGGAPTGMCPTVISDGAPCTVVDNGTTCDTFSECFTPEAAGSNGPGTCALIDSVACR